MFMRQLVDAGGETADGGRSPFAEAGADIARKKEAIAARLASADDRDGRFGETFDAALHEQPVRRAFEVEQSGRKAGRTTKQQADAERFKVLGKAVALCEGMPANPRPLPFGYGLAIRSEEHTSELQSLMRLSYA